MTQVSVAKREAEIRLDETDFGERKRINEEKKRINKEKKRIDEEEGMQYPDEINIQAEERRERRKKARQAKRDKRLALDLLY